MQALVNPHRMTVEGSDKDIKEALALLQKAFKNIKVNVSENVPIRDTDFWNELVEEDTAGFRVLGLSPQKPLFFQ